VSEELRSADLRRSAAQRRADALVEMATRSATAPADGRRPEPLFTVLVGYETLAGTICELANATMVTPGSLVRWLESAWVERVVFDSPSRVIDVGVHRRLFSGATRRAVEVRDRQCFDPTCDVPAEGCQIDHVHPRAEGGLTPRPTAARPAPTTTAADDVDRLGPTMGGRPALDRMRVEHEEREAEHPEPVVGSQLAAVVDADVAPPLPTARRQCRATGRSSWSSE
jgi:hypothetical protein